jgi:transcriptional regulator with PAS, ATPase and Fis domain
LRQLVREGRFREDLFYRVQVIPVLLPPLRDRAGDVLPLVRHLIQRHGGGRSYRLSRSALAALERHPWPGNVRELENAVQRAIALAGEKDELVVEDLVPLDPRWRGALEVSEELRPLREILRETEAAHIRRALEICGGHRQQTARMLGISRKVLWERIRDLGIEVPGEGQEP